jgi:hypothetical protein
MIRVRCSPVVLHVAARASRARQVEVAIQVTVGTLQFGVRAREWKPDRSVIEAGRLPRRRVVTVLASLRKSQGNVIGIAGLSEVCEVAADATRRRPLIFPADVATCAVQRGVCPGKREAGHLEVVEACAQPARNRMALFASDREAGRNVIGSGGLLVRSRVARVALKRKSLEPAGRGVLVATVTLQSGMSADQRETVLMVPDRLHRHLPSLYGVAASAIRSHLPAVDIGMAVRTIRAGVREYRLRVALRAREILVHAAQRKFCSVVIEFRDRPDRLPPELRVAVLTRNV